MSIRASRTENEEEFRKAKKMEEINKLTNRADHRELEFRFS